MKLIVGKSFLTRSRREVMIVMKTDIFDRNHDMFRPYLGDNGLRYTESGSRQWMRTAGQSMDDLIAPVPVVQNRHEKIGRFVDDVLAGVSRHLRDRRRFF